MIKDLHLRSMAIGDIPYSLSPVGARAPRPERAVSFKCDCPEAESGPG
jgi:hypothetical protein